MSFVNNLVISSQKVRPGTMLVVAVALTVGLIERLPSESRSAASDAINAGGSFGQFVFAPIAQKLI